MFRPNLFHPLALWAALFHLTATAQTDSTVSIIGLPIDTLPPRAFPPFHVPWIPIPEVTVIESGVPLDQLPLGSTAHAVSVLSPDVLHNTGTAALADALEFTPGVDLRARGVAGVQSDLSIRGGTFEQAALVVDGIRWSAPHTAHHLMNLPFDPEDIRQVEVLRGGTGAFTGTGAMTGSIHLQPFQAPSVNPLAKISLESGAWGWLKARAAANWSGAQNGGHTASFSHMRTDGHIENTDAMITRALWTQSLRKGDVLWRSLAGLEEKSFGAQNFYTSSFPTQFEVTRSAVAQFTRRQDFANGRLFTGAHIRHHRDRFELYREGPNHYEWTEDGHFVAGADTAASWYGGPNRHRSLTAVLTSRYEHGLGGVRLTAGADARYEQIRSNALGQQIIFDAPADLLSRGDQRLNLDAFAAARWAAPRNQVVAAMTLGMNAHSAFGARFVPAADVLVRLGKTRDWQAFASAGRSLRHPSFTDLYYTVGGAVGSEDLQPEHADQIELGLRHIRSPRRAYETRMAHRFEAEAAVFLRRGANLIDWVMFDGSDVRTAVNLGTTTFRGAEAGLTFVRDRTAPLTTAITVRHARLAGAWMDADRTSDGFTSAYVLDFLALKVDGELGLAFPKRILLDLRISHQDRRGEEFQPVAQLGLTLRRHWRLRELPLHTFLRVDNLLDAEIVDIGNVVQPGRWWRAGITFDIPLTFEN